MWFGKERILKQIKNNKGYLYVNLSLNGKFKPFFVHRLVGEAFIENKYNKPEINHIDHNPLNNSTQNLEWCTHSENMSVRCKKTSIKEIEKYSFKNLDEIILHFGNEI